AFSFLVVTVCLQQAAPAPELDRGGADPPGHGPLVPREQSRSPQTTVAVAPALVASEAHDPVCMEHPTLPGAPASRVQLRGDLVACVIVEQAVDLAHHLSVRPTPEADRRGEGHGERLRCPSFKAYLGDNRVAFAERHILYQQADHALTVPLERPR